MQLLSQVITIYLVDTFSIIKQKLMEENTLFTKHTWLSIYVGKESVHNMFCIKNKVKSGTKTGGNFLEKVSKI